MQALAVALTPRALLQRVVVPLVLAQPLAFAPTRALGLQGPLVTELHCFGDRHRCAPTKDGH